MLFNYKAITNTGEKKGGEIESASKDLAISALQRRGFIVVSIAEGEKKKGLLNLTLFERVPMKDIVIMSRQISTLFEANVPALRTLILLAENTESKMLARIMGEIAEDVQAGMSISGAMARHPEVFSDFYVNMVKVGEESGKLNETFSYLADYLDRQYQLTAKTKHALIYPGFVIGTFVTVMTLMFVFIIPKLGAIIKDSGQDVPFYTKITMGISDLLVHYGIFVLIALAIGAFYLYRLTRSDRGQSYLDRSKITIPIVRNIYKKLYLARMADNLETMISAGIPIIRSIELTSEVVGNRVYSNILNNVSEMVKSGSSLSVALAKHPEIPSIMHQMIKVGEETGSLGSILKTLGKFYTREVNEAVDTLVSLIEPLMIVALGLGVGLLLVSVLMPIYNIASGIH